MRRPLLLDAFCGAGGCSVGYHRAGFDVVGVDNRPQKNYPFEIHQADAIEFIREHGHEYDAIHASPPCQGYSRMRHLPWLKDREYPMLIEATREALESTGRLWVIENVEDAPLLNGITLCGVMFGLKVYRHRKFESNILLLAPPHQKHRVVIGAGRMLNNRQKPNAEGWVSLPGKSGGQDLNDDGTPNPGKDRARLRRDDGIVVAAGHFAGVDAAKAAMGIDWMTRDELSQAIPPDFTEFLGRQLLAALSYRGAA